MKWLDWNHDVCKYCGSRRSSLAPQPYTATRKIVKYFCQTEVEFHGYMNALTTHKSQLCRIRTLLAKVKDFSAS